MIAAPSFAGAKALRLTRCGYGVPEVLDPDVNFFVLALERAGAETYFSCGGHPEGFYILFSAPEELVRRIARCGTFMVHVEPPSTLIDCERLWSIRILGEGVATGSEERKQAILAHAAEEWTRHALA